MLDICSLVSFISFGKLIISLKSSHFLSFWFFNYIGIGPFHVSLPYFRYVSFIFHFVIQTESCYWHLQNLQSSSPVSNLLLNPLYWVLKINNCMFTSRTSILFFYGFQCFYDILHFIISLKIPIVLITVIPNHLSVSYCAFFSSLLVLSLGISINFSLNAGCWPWKIEQSLQLATGESISRLP